MGCTQTKQDINDINPRMFQVFNVDDHGREVNEGLIEISDTELILLQKNRDSIRWPLKCLRRYGFESELFSFESGRRCPTGPGIFAFKCRRAELLFNTLQECIQLAGQQEERHHNGTISTQNSRPSSVISSHSPTSHSRNGSLPNAPTHELIRDPVYMNSNIRLNNGPTYMNSQLPNNERANGSVTLDPSNVFVSFTNANLSAMNTQSNGHVLNYAVLDLPKSQDDLFELDTTTAPKPTSSANTKYADIDVDKLNALKQSQQVCASEGNDHQNSTLHYADLDISGSAAASMYMNVVPERDSPPSLRHLSVSSDEQQRMYANLELHGAAGAASAPPRRNVDLTLNRINYIELDLDNGNEMQNGQTPQSPTSITSFPESPTKRTGEMYAMIDFNRTAALSNSAKASVTEDNDGQRKTRHNSTINELP